MTRTFLFVPGDSTRKFEKAILSEADALILDLEDSVAADRKDIALQHTLKHLGSARGEQTIWVRINPLDHPRTLSDIAAIVPLQPFGLVLPKCEGPGDLIKLHHYLDALETAGKLPLGKIQILPIITETASALFRAHEYAGITTRLWGLSWGAEDLAADIAAQSNRINGRYTEPFRLARTLCLFAAASAKVRAIDTVCVDIHDAHILHEETSESVRDGFAGKMLIHPSHIDTVNELFTPTEEQLQWARAVIAAFAASPESGALSLDGKMIDIPHLRLAQRLLQGKKP